MKLLTETWYPNEGFTKPWIMRPVLVRRANNTYTVAHWNGSEWQMGDYYANQGTRRVMHDITHFFIFGRWQPDPTEAELHTVDRKTPLYTKTEK